MVIHSRDRGVARRLFVGGMLRPFFCFAKRKEPKKRRPGFVAPQKRGIPCATRSDRPLRNSLCEEGLYQERVSWRKAQTVLAESPCRFRVARRLSRGSPAFKLVVKVTRLGSRRRGSGGFLSGAYFLVSAFLHNPLHSRIPVLPRQHFGKGSGVSTKIV